MQVNIIDRFQSLQSDLSMAGDSKVDIVASISIRLVNQNREELSVRLSHLTCLINIERLKNVNLACIQYNFVLLNKGMTLTLYFNVHCKFINCETITHTSNK